MILVNLVNIVKAKKFLVEPVERRVSCNRRSG